jgi:hypothetical protein
VGAADEEPDVVAAAEALAAEVPEAEGIPEAVDALAVTPSPLVAEGFVTTAGTTEGTAEDPAVDEGIVTLGAFVGDTAVTPEEGIEFDDGSTAGTVLDCCDEDEEPVVAPEAGWRSRGLGRITVLVVGFAAVPDVADEAELGTVEALPEPEVSVVTSRTVGDTDAGEALAEMVLARVLFVFVCPMAAMSRTREPATGEGGQTESPFIVQSGEGTKKGTSSFWD